MSSFYKQFPGRLHGKEYYYQQMTNAFIHVGGIDPKKARRLATCAKYRDICQGLAIDDAVALAAQHFAKTTLDRQLWRSQKHWQKFPA